MSFLLFFESLKTFFTISSTSTALLHLSCLPVRIPDTLPLCMRFFSRDPEIDQALTETWLFTLNSDIIVNLPSSPFVFHAFSQPVHAVSNKYKL